MIGSGSALRVTLLFKNCSQEMLGIGGFGLELEGVPELSCGLAQLTLFKRDMAFCDIQSRVLPPIVGGSQFSASLQLMSTLVPVSCPDQSQPQLIMRLRTLRLKPDCFPKFSDGFLHFPFAEQASAQGEPDSREIRLASDHLTQLLNFSGPPVVRILPISYSQIESRFQEAWRERHSLL